MDCYLVVRHWPSKAFGGDRIWNLAIKITIFTYFGKGGKFKTNKENDKKWSRGEGNGTPDY